MKVLDLYNLLEAVRRELGGDYAPQQLSILLLVYRNEGITHPDIAHMMQMPQPTVSRNVKKLEQGYGFAVNRDDISSGARRSAVFLTARGKDFCRRIQTMLDAYASD